MVRQIVSLIVLIAYLNLIMGCRTTKSEKILKEELHGAREQIEQVVLSSGEAITFDANSGRYYSKGPTIEGVSEEGRPLTVDLAAIRELRTRRVPAVPLEEIKEQKIVEVVLKNRIVHKLDEAGARYDRTKDAIIGRSQEGSEFEAPMKVIRELRVTKPDTLARQDLGNNPTQSITEVVLSSDNVLVTFGKEGGKYVEAKSFIGGVTTGRTQVEIPMEKILYARISKVDAVGTFLTVIGTITAVVVAVFLIALLTKQSCPFVYSFDGEKFVFDAEPLGGAISRGLAKRDYSRLDHLKPVDGKYRLLVRNEVEETQFIDEMSLVVVDHPLNSDIVADQAGALRSVTRVTAPVSACDENGTDIKKFVTNRDEIAWQTHLTSDVLLKNLRARHQLTFKFVKPAGTKNASLIVNAGTALWGSNMIREMLALRGNKIDEWYDGIDRGGPELFELVNFIEREELYVLRVQVKEGDAWTSRGYIPGGGPLILEDRLIPLDLTGVEGDSVMIRLNPPWGFWSIDYLGIEFGAHPVAESKELLLGWARDQDETEISDSLRASDSHYYRMPKVGNWAKLEFDAPVQPDGTKRTVFLKTSGYYQLHLAKNQPEQTQRIRELSTTPGAIVQFAKEKFVQWRSLVSTAK